MDGFVSLQIVFNLIVLADMLYLHRRSSGRAPIAARPPAADARREEAARPGRGVDAPDEEGPRRRRRSRLLTLDLKRDSAAAPGPAEGPGGIDLLDLVADAEREERRQPVPPAAPPLPDLKDSAGGSGFAPGAERESSAAAPPPPARARGDERGRQRAAEEVRASIRRMQQRLDLSRPAAAGRPAQPGGALS